MLAAMSTVTLLGLLKRFSRSQVKGQYVLRLTWDLFKFWWNLILNVDDQRYLVLRRNAPIPCERYRLAITAFAAWRIHISQTIGVGSFLDASTPEIALCTFMLRWKCENVWQEQSPRMISPFLARVIATFIWLRSDTTPRRYRSQPWLGLFRISSADSERTHDRMTYSHSLPGTH